MSKGSFLPLFFALLPQTWGSLGSFCVPGAFLAPALARVSAHLLRDGTCVRVSTDGGFIQGWGKVVPPNSWANLKFFFFPPPLFFFFFPPPLPSLLFRPEQINGSLIQLEPGFSQLPHDRNYSIFFPPHIVWFTHRWLPCFCALFRVAVMRWAFVSAMSPSLSPLSGFVSPEVQRCYFENRKVLMY